MNIDINFAIPLFWFYIPATISAISSILMTIIYVADNRPGQGLVALVSLVFWVILNVFVWFIYFGTATVTGIR